jgi:hypothetical protein
MGLVSTLNFSFLGFCLLDGGNGEKVAFSNNEFIAWLLLLYTLRSERINARTGNFLIRPVLNFYKGKGIINITDIFKQ